MSNRRVFLRNLIGASAGIGLMQIPKGLFASQGLERLTILHTNDIHCHIDSFPEDDPLYKGQGGLARMAATINRIRQDEENVLLLDAGDMFQGTPYFNYYKGELIWKVMSKMGYAASTIGNHEFDNGLEGIEKPLEFKDFPLVNSNYDFSNTILANRFPKHLIRRKGDVKIGIYGLGIELDGLVGKKNYEETIYNDPVEVALEQEAFLKHEKKCDLVICLSHLGFEYKKTKVSDKLLAPQTHYTDLIVGGHTHTFLDAPVELKNADGERIIINQVSWAGLMLGRIDFIFDRNRREGAKILAQNLNPSA